MVYRYLAEQVWHSLDDRIRSFLRTAAFLPRLETRIAVAAGFDDAAAIIEALRERVAFITVLDAGVYKLHDLFRDFVQRQLAARRRRSAQRRADRRRARAGDGGAARRRAGALRRRERGRRHRARARALQLRAARKRLLRHRRARGARLARRDRDRKSEGACAARVARALARPRRSGRTLVRRGPRTPRRRRLVPRRRRRALRRDAVSARPRRCVAGAGSALRARRSRRRRTRRAAGRDRDDPRLGRRPRRSEDRDRRCDLARRVRRRAAARADVRSRRDQRVLRLRRTGRRVLRARGDAPRDRGRPVRSGLALLQQPRGDALVRRPAPGRVLVRSASRGERRESRRPDDAGVRTALAHAARGGARQRRPRRARSIATSPRSNIAVRSR